MCLDIKKASIQDCKVAMFKMRKSDLKDSSKLWDYDPETIQLRQAMIFNFNKAFHSAIKFVNSEDRNTEGCISYYHFNNKNMIVPSVVNDIVDKQLKSISSGGMARVNINRRKAFVF